MFYTMCMKCGEEWALGDERSCKCSLKTEAMTRDDIILMAREAELLLDIGTTFPYAEGTDIGPMLKRFAALVAAAEREACAAIAEKELGNTAMLTSMPPKSSAAWNILFAIRARGET